MDFGGKRKATWPGQINRTPKNGTLPDGRRVAPKQLKRKTHITHTFHTPSTPTSEQARAARGASQVPGQGPGFERRAQVGTSQVCA